MRTALNRAAVSAALVVAAALLTACGSNPTAVVTSTPTTTPTSTAPNSPAPTTTDSTPPPTGSTLSTGAGRTTPALAATSAAPAYGCAPTGTGVPTGASTKQVIDVDGDGQPDTGWLSSDGNTFGITTASGATMSVPLDLTGGGPRSVLVENPDSTGTITALASDGRTVELLVVTNCGLFPATNAQGAHYEFDLGVRGTGTGVGCAQITGTPGRSLVGLNVHLNPAGQPDSVHRTQITLTDTAARNGATDTIPTTNNPSAAQSANTISCGNLTMTHDGITEHR